MIKGGNKMTKSKTKEQLLKEKKEVEKLLTEQTTLRITYQAKYYAEDHKSVKLQSAVWKMHEAFNLLHIAHEESEKEFEKHKQYLEKEEL